MSENANEGVVELAASVPVRASQGASPSLPSASKRIQLQDGRIITFTKPKKPLNLFINAILADCKNYIIYEAERSRIKPLLYVSKIDDEQINMIQDQMSREALEEKIGEENLDGLMVAFNQLFPSNEAILLDQVKKP